MRMQNQLDEMQWKQLRHDENYHKDIWLLTVQQRITHMALHLSKYSSKLTISAFENDSHTLKKTIIDSLIIVFSSANIFSCLLSSLAVDEQLIEETSIDSLGSRLLELLARDEEITNIKLSLKILKITGYMCKIVESLDHLETLDFREKLLKSLGDLFKLLIAISSNSGINNIEKEIAERLYSVESKNIYFSKMGNYIKGY